MLDYWRVVELDITWCRANDVFLLFQRTFGFSSVSHSTSRLAQDPSGGLPPQLHFASPRASLVIPRIQWSNRLHCFQSGTMWLLESDLFEGAFAGSP
jgi:hypothetical protein